MPPKRDITVPSQATHYIYQCGCSIDVLDEGTPQERGYICECDLCSGNSQLIDGLTQQRALACNNTPILVQRRVHLVYTDAINQLHNDITARRGKRSKEGHLDTSSTEQEAPSRHGEAAQ